MKYVSYEEVSRERKILKNLLLVAYHYPPEGSSSGVLRTLKFSRYLPGYGWTPHVLTLRERIYQVRDDGLKAEIPPEATVHRVAAWDTVRHFSIRGRHLEWMAVPDRYISWFPFAVAQGLKVIRRVDISALFSTSPPPTAHLIAGALKLRTGLPWVADFRDPWIEDGIHPRPGSLRFRVESRLERFVIHWADRVTVTTPEFRVNLLERYPDLPPGKFRVIFNGYDEGDFRHIGDGTVPSRFEILHAGMVTPEYRDPVPLLRAVSSLIQEGQLPRAEVRIVFLGGGAYLETPAFCRTVAELELMEVVQILGRIPHRNALSRLREAAVLLLLQASDDTRSLIPAKAFEYLRVGRPILALTPDGATSALLRSAGVGAIVDPSSPKSLREAVYSLYLLWKREPERVVRPSDISRFSRVALTGELARLLDAVMLDRGNAQERRHTSQG